MSTTIRCLPLGRAAFPVLALVATLATGPLYGHPSLPLSAAADQTSGSGDQAPQPTGAAKRDGTNDPQRGQSAGDAGAAPTLSADEAARNRELVRRRMELCQQRPEVCVQREKDQDNRQAEKRGNPAENN
jgi:hypothetical protein